MDQAKTDGVELTNEQDVQVIIRKTCKDLINNRENRFVSVGRGAYCAAGWAAAQKSGGWEGGGKSVWFVVPRQAPLSLRGSSSLASLDLTLCIPGLLRLLLTPTSCPTAPPPLASSATTLAALRMRLLVCWAKCPGPLRASCPPTPSASASRRRTRRFASWNTVSGGRVSGWCGHGEASLAWSLTPTPPPTRSFFSICRGAD